MPLRRLPFWLLLVTIAALTAAPLFVVDVVPLLDYPAHLARVTLLANQPLDPVVAARYAVDIRPLANLGLDLAVPPLARLVGPAIGLKLFITLGIVLWLVGAALIHRALWREWSVQALFAAFFVVNASFLDAYINFFVAAGLALTAAGIWIDRPRRGPLFLLVMAAIAVVLLFCHLMALAIFLMLIAAFDLGRHLGPPLDRAGLARSAVSIALVALPAFLLWAFVLERGGGGDISFNWPANALALAIYASTFGGIAFNMLPTAAVLAALLAAARFRRLTIARAGVPALALVALAMLLMPVTAMGGAGLQVRLPAITMIVLLATARIGLDDVRWTGRIAAGLIAVVALGSALETALWRGPAATIDRFRAAARAVLPEGARIATVLATPADTDFWHAADLLVPEHKMFVPAFFTVVGQSTIRLQPAYAQIGAQTAIEGAGLKLAAALPLLAETAPTLSEADRARFRPYLDLPCTFDAVVLFGALPVGTATPATLAVAHTDAAFTLYRTVAVPTRACPPR